MTSDHREPGSHVPGGVVLEIERRARRGRERDLERDIRALADALDGTPGHRATLVDRTPTGYRLRTVFDDELSLRAWQLQPAQQAVVDGLDRDSRLTGRRLGGATTLPSSERRRWSGRVGQVLAAVVAVYPLSLLLQAATGPFVGDWPLAGRAAVVAVPIATVMTLVVAPLLRRLAARRSASLDHARHAPTPGEPA